MTLDRLTAPQDCASCGLAFSVTSSSVHGAVVADFTASKTGPERCLNVDPSLQTTMPRSCIKFV